MFHPIRQLTTSLLVVLLVSELAESTNPSRDCEDCLVGHLVRVPGCAESRLGLAFPPEQPDLDRGCHCNLIQDAGWASSCERVCAGSYPVDRMGSALVAGRPSDCPALHPLPEQVTVSTTMKDPVLVEAESSGSTLGQGPVLTTLGMLTVATSWWM
ncbi:hypothetical protein K493DRAFT_305507 [Basidiobolus meristosporus CBS 931.73]|uniref:Uncharacterized protein n=1 Tax=Basidiobolus meristosporus CBS 931.73 TaxID=1314790 RepID=A0A1Y1XVH0_9FUNG|nr:hypothetical protein K493DRAFT_305507 [Basidiobolus meristosporus CBS 931.73]|eukprot:ORX89748.1 hypothetical protein K493DRAFT_305507 [Basidiobolus meristosporus CBS 931.73]